MNHPAPPRVAATPYDSRDEAVRLIRPTPMRRPSHVTRPMRPRDYRPLFRALYAVALLCVASGVTSLVVLASGCHPNLGPVVNCRVGSYECVRGAPVVCSQSQRWQPVGNRDCAAVGAVCVAPTDGPAHCARAPSDAAAEAPDASDGGAE